MKLSTPSLTLRVMFASCVVAPTEAPTVTSAKLTNARPALNVVGAFSAGSAYDKPAYKLFFSLFLMNSAKPETDL